MKRGWINKAESTDDLENEYCRFFPRPSIDSVPAICHAVEIISRSRTRRSGDSGLGHAGKTVAEEQSISKFNVESSTIILDVLLSLTKEEGLVENVPDVLINHGIHFIYVPHLPKTFLDGAALWTDKNPIVALSLRYDRIDAFWFTVLHEFAHIFLNHEQLHIDRLFDHDQGTPDIVEQQTNEQVIDWLFPENKLDNFIELNKPRYSRNRILEFAEQLKRHPGIIVGQLMVREELSIAFT